jgi:lambda family phage portal protein
MGLFSRSAKQPAAEVRKYAPNPMHKARNAFTSVDVDRLLKGWDTTSETIDHYLRSELRQMRARSRKMVRSNPYGKRFVQTIKANVIGPSGVNFQSQSVRLNGELDTPANSAIELAFAEWGYMHCDRKQQLSWVDMQNLALSSAAQDGEFIFRKWYSGPHGFQLELIDAELLDVEKNQFTKSGGEIRLGVEYDKQGRRIRYHFKKRAQHTGGGYESYERYSIDAREIIHGYVSEWADQSRGAPWMHASLERSKHLEKYEEAAIVKARSTAATMAVMRTPAGDEPYQGDEDAGDGVTLDQFEPGTIKDIGDREITNLDSDYPHQMYGAFVKAHLQGIASGLGISYHSLSNDLEGVNYSSIRAGVLEDREVFKGLQNWFIRTLIRPVYEEWITISVMRQLITIGRVPLSKPVQEYYRAHFQGRRWAWVDPQKDGAANQLAIDNLTKSRSQIIREQGDDPESVFREIQSEKQMLERLGLSPTAAEAINDAEED